MPYWLRCFILKSLFVPQGTVFAVANVNGKLIHKGYRLCGDRAKDYKPLKVVFGDMFARAIYGISSDDPFLAEN